MILLAAATELEMGPLRRALAGVTGADFLVTGVGPVETAISLTRQLAIGPEMPRVVVNIGVGGAFIGTGVRVLDLCLAEKEFFGDLGICAAGEVLPFDFPLPVEFELDNEWLRRAENSLAACGIHHRKGNFVTVCGVSATCERGLRLRDRFQAVCENMEGAAMARVCQAFGVPCLELRCISNLVEERDPGKWQLRSAAELAAQAAAAIFPTLAG